MDILDFNWKCVRMLSQYDLVALNEHPIAFQTCKLKCWIWKGFYLWGLHHNLANEFQSLIALLVFTLFQILENHKSKLLVCLKLIFLRLLSD